MDVLSPRLWHYLPPIDSDGLRWGWRVLGVTDMGPTWRHADVFPVVARLIDVAHRESGQFVTASELARRLLQDSEGRLLVEESHCSDNSLEWIANNMVAWFSQRITIGDSDWASAFERIKMDGCWAYRPFQAGD